VARILSPPHRVTVALTGQGALRRLEKPFDPAVLRQGVLAVPGRG